MSATVSRSSPVPIPNVNDPITFSYKEIVRNLTANAPQPYGAIPPLMKKRKQKKKRQTRQQPQAVRRMSHVENWVAVDSKESLPDDEDLIHSPFQNFLSVDFLTGILPLHMPPPSLSDPTTLQHQQEISNFAYQYRQNARSTDSLKQMATNGLLDQDEDDEEDDDDDDDEDTENFALGTGSLEDDDDEEFDEEDDDDGSDFSPGEKSGGKDSAATPVSNTLSPLSLLPSTAATTALDTGSIDGNTLQVNKVLVGRRSIPSFTKSHTPSTSTTTSYAISSSPPDQDKQKWIHTIAKLRQSLALSQPSTSTDDNSLSSDTTDTDSATPPSGTGIFIATPKLSSKSLPSSLSSSPSSDTNTLTNDRAPFIAQKGPQPLTPPIVLKKSSSSSTVTSNNNKPGFIPMPLPPRRKRSTKKRRSEATTQPRFNVNTNTYTRDTRSNPDHLRMIAAELNMMRSRKLFSPLKPRGFLPRRKDPFICGDGRLRSPLQFEVV